MESQRYQLSGVYGFYIRYAPATGPYHLFQQMPKFNYSLQVLTCSLNIFAWSSHPGSVLMNSVTWSRLQSDTVSPLILYTPGSSLQCCSQHSGRSLAGLATMADMNTDWWIPLYNDMVASPAEESNTRVVTYTPTESLIHDQPQY